MDGEGLAASQADVGQKAFVSLEEHGGLFGLRQVHGSGGGSGPGGGQWRKEATAVAQHWPSRQRSGMITSHADRIDLYPHRLKTRLFADPARLCYRWTMNFAIILPLFRKAMRFLEIHQQAASAAFPLSHHLPNPNERRAPL